MHTLRDHEKEVIRLLTASLMPTGLLERILNESEFVDYNYTGAGYFFTVRHPELPVDRIVCSTPLIVGEADQLSSGYIVYIENHELTLECHSWDGLVAADYRDRDVQLSIKK